MSTTLGDIDLHLVAEGRHEHAVAGAGRAPARARGRDRAPAFVRVGAERHRNVRVVGESQRLGRRRATRMRLDGRQRACGRLFVPGVGLRGVKYKFEIAEGAAGVWIGSRPTRWRSAQEPPGHRFPRVHQHPRVAGRRLARRAREAAARQRADGDLRAAPRLVEEAPRRLLLDLRRAGGGPARLPRRPRLHPRRADAGHAAPVRWLVGLPGHVLLRARPRASAPRTTSATSSTHLHAARASA